MTRRRCIRCSSRSRRSISNCFTGFDGPAVCPAIRISRRPSSPPTPAPPSRATCTAETSALGRGISKGDGMARAHRYLGQRGRIVVMTGDGELQEGQIWESLQPAANERLSEITVVVDSNKFQSDSTLAAVSDLGRLEDKFQAFGWHVRRADGH